MNVSEAKVEANRKNIQLSTGLRTPEGKARSRANALKHGLCSAVCLPEEPSLIQNRSDHGYKVLRPQHEFHSWMVDCVTPTSVKRPPEARPTRPRQNEATVPAEQTQDLST